MKTAQMLKYSDFSYRDGTFTFSFDIDGERQEITLAHSQKSVFAEKDVLHIGFCIGMCYLLDLAEIVLPKKIELFANLTSDQLAFWKNLYEDVAKEKMYALGLDLALLEIPWTTNPTGPSFTSFKIPTQKDAVSLCLTGGKESLALLKMLAPTNNFTLFYLNLEKSVHRQKVYEKFKDTYHSIRTTSNRFQVTTPLKEEYGNLFSGVDMAHLVFNTLLFADHYSCVLIGNEYSSNFPNEIYQGYAINHQFVKTVEFARRINAYLHQHVTPDYAYYSPFFPLYEYRIADILFQNDEYLDVWTSCNQATPEINFCSNCAKCAFTYLVSRVRRDEEFLAKFFSRNLLNDVELYKPIMDFVGKKPLDCVGDSKEVWVGLYTLLQMGVKGEVITYFEKNILPQIQNRIEEYVQEVNAPQRVPFHMPSKIAELITPYLK